MPTYEGGGVKYVVVLHFDEEEDHVVDAPDLQSALGVAKDEVDQYVNSGYNYVEAQITKFPGGSNYPNGRLIGYMNSRNQLRQSTWYPNLPES